MPPLEVYGSLPAVELMRLSPSGARYAFVTVVNEKRMFVVVGEDGKALYANDVSDTKPRDIRWVGEDHVLVILSSTLKARLLIKQAYEVATVINVRLSDKKVFAIFGQHREVSRLRLACVAMTT